MIAHRTQVAVLLAVGGAIAVGIALAPPIPQDPEYHRFVDGRALAGLPNAWNVLSNVVFAVVGVAGLAFVLRRASADAFATRAERVLYAAFFLGVLGTAFGSAWYHLDPTTERLFWDRLPMAVGFMAIAAAIVGERIHPRAPALLGPPLVAIGLLSVWLWRASEAAGRGDLRVYAAVQYAPLALVPLSIALFPTPRREARAVFTAFAWYGIAKVGELLDGPVYAATGFVSGHTLKHVAAAVAAWVILRMLARRRDGAASAA